MSSVKLLIPLPIISKYANQLLAYALLVIFFFVGACSQHLPSNPTAHQKAKALYLEVINWRFEKPDLALAAADSILLLNSQYDIDTFQIGALSQKSLLLSEKRQMPEALELAEKALRLWEPVDGVFAQCKAFEQLGQCHLVLKNYDDALKNFKEELERAPQCGKKALGIETYACGYIGDVYYAQRKMKESLDYYQQGIDCAKKTGDGALLAGELTNAAKIFGSLGDQNRRMDCLRQAAISFDSNDYRRAAAFINLSETFSELKQNDSANYYLTKVYEMKVEHPVIRLVSMIGYSGILTEKGQLKTARKLLDESILLAHSINDFERKGIAYNQMGESFAAEKTYKKALFYSLKADSILSAPATEATFLAKYEAAKNVLRFQLLADGRPDKVNQLEKMENMKDSMAKKEYIEILESYKNQILTDSLVLLSIQNQVQNAEIKTKDALLWSAALLGLLLAFLAFIGKRNLGLSKENLQILTEQNQRLESDNQNLKNDLEIIREQKTGDASEMLEQPITLPTRNNLSLKLGEIMYLQAFGGGVHYFTADKKHLVWHGFEESMKMLPAEFFVKTHRSYIVNKTFVEQISNTKVFLKNGAVIPIGITIKDAVHKQFET